MSNSGLINIGNTCCLNALIQCMYHLKSIRTACVPSEKDDQCLLNALTNLFKTMFESRDGGSPNNPRDFVKVVLKSLNGKVVFGEQWDLNEIWTLVIDSLSDEHKTEPKGYVPPIQTHISGEALHQVQCKADGVWAKSIGNMRAEWATIVHGMQIGQLLCPFCKYICHNLEPFTSVTLQIRQQNDAQSLNDCFYDYFKTEVIDEWKCDKCANKVGAEKLMRFWVTPTVLAINVKRFGFTNDGNGFSIQTPLNIPLQFTFSHGTEIGYEKQKAYELKAVGLHFGGLNRGHYVAVCNDGNGKWYMYDDDTTHIIEDINGFLKACRNAYMLFYELC